MQRLTHMSQSIGSRGREGIAWYQDRYRANPPRTIAATYTLALLLVIAMWVVALTYSGLMVRAHANHLSDLMDDPDQIEFSSGQVQHLHDTVASMDRNLNRLDRLTTVPLVSSQVERLPVLGDRYRAVRQTFDLGTELTWAGRTAATIAHEGYQSLQTNGISYDEDSAEESWLTTIDQHRDQIPEIIRAFERAEAMRGEIDESALPGVIRDRLETLDSAFDRSDELIELAESYDDFFHAAGGNGTIRYLFLFKNPAELRPSGGFPGTFGVFEFNAGQLVDYEMWDSHDVTRNYIEHRTEKRPQPWPFEQFAPQDGLLLHDATWYSDFPYTASLMMEMYEETTWPEINGIVAVQPEAVSDLVSITGPVMVEIDGEMREINEDNVYDEVEQYRWARFQGDREGVLGDHKDILIDMGEAIMDAFTSSEDIEIGEAAAQLMDAATRRDLQMYVAQPGVQAFLDRRGWSGKLDPHPDVPVLAITYTNFVLEKASMAMDPYYNLHLVPQEDGYRAIMHMTLEHTGLHDQDPRYFGFQRWWIEVAMPEGSEWIASNYDLQPDPEAHNGGSYKVNLFPEETKEIYVVFTLPEMDELMIRRQPGQVPPDVHVHMPGCDTEWGGYLVRDLMIDLSDRCPAIDEDEIEDEKPEMLQLS
jgi:hypothetical protein